jgi:hypothetical protein
MDSRYLKKKKLENKEEVMKALEEQRGKYDETFELWNAKQAELEEKRQDHHLEYRKNQRKDYNKEKGPNKYDYYD